MNQNENFSIIEHLPNELFLDIFQYINTRDLYRIWSKLNKRFTKLLHSVSMYAHLTEINDYKNYKFSFRYYSLQIIYIRIEEICHLPEIFHLNYFSNIRSLHLSVINDKQYDQIIPDNMPYLTYLTINKLHGNRNPAFLLFGLKQFLHLKSCHLPYIFNTNAHLQPCLTLRSLHLNFCSMEIFIEKVKILLPNLVYFQSVLGRSLINFDITADKQHLMKPHNILRHIKIEFDRNTRTDFLSLLLSILPELRCLELHCEYYYDYQDLAELLRTKLPQLKQFNFIVEESHYHNLPDIEILKRISFWFSQMKLEQYDQKRRIVCNMKK